MASGRRLGDCRIRAPERPRAGRTRATMRQQAPPPDGQASPANPASARLTEETPTQANDLLRQAVYQGWRPERTDCPRNVRSSESTQKGVGPGQTGITTQTSSQNNRWTGRPHRSPGNGAPPGVDAGWVGTIRKLRLKGMARRREIASERKLMHLVRQESRLRPG
jgi:hypothetical protein